MKEEIKSVWVAALRGQLNTEYQQVGGALQKDSKGFCCLGVLCDLHALAEPGRLAWNKSGLYVRYGRADDLPPRAVYDWAGLHHTTASRLACMNDGGASFAEIADYIEKKL